ncbi:MAG TPA: hypothetical protein VLA98_10205 [Solirubrobacteraceae bacterium]|nr:hypothetical protein [Solirubrobacteraceae bacterium]
MPITVEHHHDRELVHHAPPGHDWLRAALTLEVALGVFAIVALVVTIAIVVG